MHIKKSIIQYLVPAKKINKTIRNIWNQIGSISIKHLIKEQKSYFYLSFFAEKTKYYNQL